MAGKELQQAVQTCTLQVQSQRALDHGGFLLLGRYNTHTLKGQVLHHLLVETRLGLAGGGGVEPVKMTSPGFLEAGQIHGVDDVLGDGLQSFVELAEGKGDVLACKVHVLITFVVLGGLAHHRHGLRQQNFELGQSRAVESCDRGRGHDRGRGREDQRRIKRRQQGPRRLVLQEVLRAEPLGGHQRPGIREGLRGLQKKRSPGRLSKFVKGGHGEVKAIRSTVRQEIDSGRKKDLLFETLFQTYGRGEEIRDETQKLHAEGKGKEERRGGEITIQVLR